MGQIVYCKSSPKVPLELLGEVNVAIDGSNRKHAVVQIEGGVYIRPGLIVSKFLIPYGEIDPTKANPIEL